LLASVVFITTDPTSVLVESLILLITAVLSLGAGLFDKYMRKTMKILKLFIPLLASVVFITTDPTSVLVESLILLITAVLSLGAGLFDKSHFLIYLFV
jgi:hypothetical protein